MSDIFKANKWYFVIFNIFFLAGIVLLASINQGDVILFFSNNRSEAGDLFFSYFTRMGEEWLYILAITGLLFVRFRYVVMVPFVALTVLLVSFSTKSYFAHDRPSIFFKKAQLFDQINLVEGITLLNGPTSFPSGHTMSAFAMYGLLALIVKDKRISALLLFFAALLVGISRMYLVQHFLKDVVTGAVLGTSLAILAYYLQSRIPYDPKQWIDRSLTDFWPKKEKTPVA